MSLTRGEDEIPEVPGKGGGPRSAQGKLRASMNSLKHGRYARRSSYAQMLSASMAELGEDPEEFVRLRRDLVDSFHPSTPAAVLLVDNLASLHWQRRRLERGQAALIARRVQQLELKRQRRSLQVSQQTEELVTVSELGMGMIYSHSQDSPTRFQKLLEWLETLKGCVETSQFDGYETLVSWIYGPHPTLRGATIKALFGELASKPNQPARVAALRREIEAEICNITQQYQLYIRKYVEVTPLMREECLAPTEGQRWLNRELNMIDRQITQKTRLLLEMEREQGELGAPVQEKNRAPQKLRKDGTLKKQRMFRGATR